MAELTIDPASIRKALDDFVASYKPSDTPTQEVGYVATAGDGIEIGRASCRERVSSPV